MSDYDNTSIGRIQPVKKEETADQNYLREVVYTSDEETELVLPEFCGESAEEVPESIQDAVNAFLK